MLSVKYRLIEKPSDFTAWTSNLKASLVISCLTGNRQIPVPVSSNLLFCYAVFVLEKVSDKE